MDITQIASFVSAITVIGGFFYKLHTMTRSFEKKHEEMEEMLKTNTIHILKIAVLNPNLPLIDRIHAGEQYIAMGGNGTIKRIYEGLLDEYEKELRGNEGKN